MAKLLDTLQWAGLRFDEGPGTSSPFGPYIQSERLDIYQKYAEYLLLCGKAYRCYCSKERLAALRGPDGFGHYDGYCRNLSSSQRASRGSAPSVVRFRVPVGETIFRDLVFGRHKVSNALVGDAILLKSDGFPTYHFANVVDDHLMAITTVLRGQEWIPSTPLHVLLYETFGWPMPRFGHLPLLLNKDKVKLSKRNNDALVDYYRQYGYFPVSLLNFVALLGWAPRGNRELMNLEEMVEEFDVHRINHADATVDIEKLRWANRQHLQLLVTSDGGMSAMVGSLRNILPNEHQHHSDDFLAKCISLMARRVTFLHEIPETARYLLERPSYSADLIVEATQTGIIDLFNNFVTSLDFASVQHINKTIHIAAEASCITPRSALQALRFALTGSRMGAPVAETMCCLGKSETIERILLFSDFLTTTQTVNK